MSLFVGNISSRVRHSELERAFQRFGRSNLELKDGYGFVVYDTVGDAEKALRALKGKIICGEQPSITWARKRRPFRRFSAKEFPQSRGYGNKGFRKEDNDIKGRSSQEWEETSMDVKKHAGYDKKGAERNDFHGKDGRDDGFENDMVEEGGKHQNFQEEALDEECTVQPVPLENDRWGEPISEASNEHDRNEEPTDLQRYDPYSADKRRDGDAFENEKCRRVTSNDSYAPESSLEKASKHRSRDETRMGQRFLQKSPERCYVCGRTGHVMWQCRAKADFSRRDNYGRFGSGRNGQRNFRGNGYMRFNRPRDADWSRRDFTREPVLQRNDFSGRKNMEHVKDRRRQHERTAGFPEQKRKHGRQLSEDRRESQTRDRTGRGHKKLRKESISRYARGRHTSHSSHRRSENQHQSHSNSSRSRSQSSSSRSLSSGSRSCSASSRSQSPHSDSRSSRSHSVSSYSKSQSVSLYSRSAKATSNSRSRSPTPRSLSVSLSPKVQRSASPSTQFGRDVCGSYNATSARHDALPSKPQEDLSGQIIHSSNVSTSYMEVEDMRLAVKAENDLRVRIIQDDEKIKPVRHIDESGNFFNSECNGKRGNTSIHKDENADLSDEKADRHIAAQAYRMKDDLLNSEFKAAELQTDTSMQPIFQKSSPLHGKGGSKSLLGDKKTIANISLQEVHMILKHSGGASIENAENGSSVEAFFGAACLWPWEAIHYRRLKRGPISTSNYARRIAQNEKFGIVDKYIRSSSGWWENESHEF